MKKTAIAVSLFLMFLAMSCFSTPVAVSSQVPLQTTQSLDAIYIRADSIVEGTDKIQRVSDVFTFTADIYDSIVVERGNIVVDGAGYTLHGKMDTYTEKGIEILRSNNVTMKNLNIEGFTRGVRLTNSSDCLIHQNILTNNIGIEMGYVDGSYSNNNSVNGNTIRECEDGIRLICGTSNIIYGNTITASNISGISVWGTAGNSIIGNNITNNKRGIYFETSGVNTIHHNNFVNNVNDWWDYGLTPWPFQLPFSVNVWDDGKEGNYWGTYDGADNNGDGIGDVPHELYESNTDKYPLINPVTIPELPYEKEPTKPTEEPFPTTLVIAFVIAVTIVVLGLVYFKKSNRNKNR